MKRTIRWISTLCAIVVLIVAIAFMFGATVGFKSAYEAELARDMVLQALPPGALRTKLTELTAAYGPRVLSVILGVLGLCSFTLCVVLLRFNRDWLQPAFVRFDRGITTNPARFRLAMFTVAPLAALSFLAAVFTGGYAWQLPPGERAYPNESAFVPLNWLHANIGFWVLPVALVLIGCGFVAATARILRRRPGDPTKVDPREFLR